MGDDATKLAELLGVESCGAEELEALARAEKIMDAGAAGVAAILLGRTNFPLESQVVEPVVEPVDDAEQDDESDQL